MSNNTTVDPYRVQYTASQYTFPKATRIAKVTFTDTHMVFELEDGRTVGVPLAWIPSVANAAPADRAKYFLGEERLTIHWNPEDGGINDDLRLADYLVGLPVKPMT